MAASNKNWIYKLPYILVILAWLGLGYLLLWPVFGPAVPDNTALTALAPIKKLSAGNFTQALEKLLNSPQFQRLAATPEDAAWLNEPVNTPVAVPGIGGYELVGRPNPFVIPTAAEIFPTTATVTDTTTTTPVTTSTTAN